MHLSVCKKFQSNLYFLTTKINAFSKYVSKITSQNAFSKYFAQLLIQRFTTRRICCRILLKLFLIVLHIYKFHTNDTIFLKLISRLRLESDFKRPKTLPTETDSSMKPSEFENTRLSPSQESLPNNDYFSADSAEAEFSPEELQMVIWVEM